jgi:hypothetical protein
MRFHFRPLGVGQHISVHPKLESQYLAWGNPKSQQTLDRSPRHGALIDGKRVAVDRVWTTRSLRPVSPEEYAFRMGPLRRWARADPQMPEARPQRSVDLAALPPLF